LEAVAGAFTPPLQPGDSAISLARFFSRRLPGFYLFWMRNPALLMVLSLLILLLGAALVGANEANVALKTEVYNYKLSLTTSETMQVNLLVVTSDTLIVMQNSSEISVVPRAQVKLLKRVDLPGPTRPG
jgi:hypothetical protein